MFASSPPSFKKKESIPAKVDHKKLLVRFNIENVTLCVGYIIKGRVIVSTLSCGTDFEKTKKPGASRNIIPYCDGYKIKIKDNKVRFAKKSISFMTVCLLILFSSR